MNTSTLCVVLPPALSLTVTFTKFGPRQQNEALKRTEAPLPMISPVEADHLYVSGWFSGSVAFTVIVELEPTSTAVGFAVSD